MASTSPISSTSSLDQLGQQYQAMLVSQEITPLQTQQDTLNDRLTALNTLKTKLKTLYDSANGLTQTGSSSEFKTFTVASSQTSVATATATSSAMIGTHTLQVSQLAKSDTALSGQLATSGANASSIIGAEGAGVKTFRISVNGTDTDVNVTLNAGDTNATILSAIATAVNGSGSAVRASVVSDTPTTSRLVLTSTSSGSANAISLSDQTGTLLNSIGLGAGVVGGREVSTATTGGYIYSDAGTLDAKFKLDGIDITRSTNTVSDVLSGVTLQLAGVQNATDTPVALSISVDTSSVEGSIQAFISDYNDVMNYINSNSTIDVKAGVNGVFSSDASIRSVRSDLRSMAGLQVSSVASGSLSMLSQLGVTTNSDGTLTLSDTTKLESALASNPTQVSDIFNSSNGIAVRMKSYLNQYVTYGGEMDTEANSVSSQVTNLGTRMDRINAQIDTQVQNYIQQFAQIQELLQEAEYQQQMIQSLFSTSTSSTTTSSS